VGQDNKDFNSLVAVSINHLYDGMEIQEDVYDADAVHLLVKHGERIDAEIIERIRKINSGRETIHVSGNTYRAIMEKLPVIVPDSRRELEETIGYTTATDVAFEMLHELSRDQVIKQDALRSVSAELSNRIEVTSQSAILSLINALAPVDEYLQRHCVNVGLLNGLFGQWLHLPKKDIDGLVLVGLLHDCGKALIPPQVLNAPRKLTVIEFEVVKMHPVYSYDLLSAFPESVRLASRGHHEKVGGAGYPDGLPPMDIPLISRITAVSDIYDAMVSQRAYKKPRSPFSVMAVLAGLKNSELDSTLVDVFLRSMPQQLVDKQVVMSDGVIGVIRSFDPADIEYPMIEVDGRVIKSHENWQCASMYTTE